MSSTLLARDVKIYNVENVVWVKVVLCMPKGVWLVKKGKEEKNRGHNV